MNDLTVIDEELVCYGLAVVVRRLTGSQSSLVVSIMKEHSGVGLVVLPHEQEIYRCRIELKRGGLRRRGVHVGDVVYGGCVIVWCMGDLGLCGAWGVGGSAVRGDR